jgi:type IV pilus assembly protein PilM
VERVLGRRVVRWLDAMPHPPLACEIAESHVAITRGWQLALEPLPEGVIAPSPVELNLLDAAAVTSRLQSVLGRLAARPGDAALILPDQVVRVFLLHFETFPRRAEEATPLLRWRLRKSVPFDVDDTVVSYMAQPAPPAATGGVEVLAGVARQRVVRQYEEVLEAAGLKAGVVVGATLASLALAGEDRATLLVRITGKTLITLIARGESLCVYRCTDLPEGVARVAPAAVLDEIYPAIAYFQDTWRENVAEVRLAGFGARFEDFRRALEAELGGRVQPLLASSALPELPAEGQGLVDKQLDALIGWGLQK